jgi:hypothetical protein
MRTDPKTMTGGQENPLHLTETTLIPTGHLKTVYRKIWCKNLHPTETVNQLTITHIDQAHTYGTLGLCEAIGDDYITDASAYTYASDVRLLAIAPSEEKAFWLKWAAPIPTVGGTLNEINLRVEIA